MLFGFIGFMVLFTIIGLWSVRHSTGSTEDYLLASNRVPAWLAGLSAVATNNSGYMFIGMIGYTYAEGLSAIWIMLGWVVGDYCASKMLYEKVRNKAGEGNILSYSGLLSNWQGTEFRRVRILAGLLTIIFLTAYAAAQLKAGGKALHVLLGWDYNTGTILGTVLVLAYCFAGGIRASIWTDAAQSFVMIFAMALVCFLAVSTSGGITPFIAALDAVAPDYLAWFPHNETLGAFFGPVLFVGGWLFAGFGVAGQPHIMVRFMAIESAEAIAKARIYYYSWFASFFGLTVLAGLAARIFVSGDADFDMELALPLMAQQLLPGIGLGIILAGLFAATMSTADSQILSCTAAVTQDLFQKRGKSIMFTKAVTLVLAFLAMALALSDNQSVFSLVLMAWAGLSSAFVPLLVVQVFGGKPSENVALAMILVGFGVCVYWMQAGLGSIVYEIVPGIVSGFAVYALASLLPKRQAV